MAKKKVLIAVYITTEGCRKIAEALKNDLEQNNFEVVLEEVKPVLELKEFEYSKLDKIELVNKNFDVRSFDLIVIGFNVWSYNVSPVVETYLKSLKNTQGERFAVFCKCIIPGNAVRKIEAIINTMQGKVIKSKLFQSLFDVSPQMINDAKAFGKLLREELKNSTNSKN